VSRQAPRPRSPETPKPPETWRLGPRKASEAPVTARQVDFKVLCLPAADHGDEVAAELFVKLVEVQGIEASAASISALKSEMLDRVEESAAEHGLHLRHAACRGDPMRAICARSCTPAFRAFRSSSPCGTRRAT
jgi:hypothetical protein